MWSLARSGVWRVGPAVVYTVWLFIKGTSAVGGAAWINDKLLHVVAFGGLALLCAPAIAFFRGALSQRGLLITSFSTSVFFGAVLEIVQHFLPYRSAELADLLADAVGAAVACSLLGWWMTWRSSRKIPQS